MARWGAERAAARGVQLRSIRHYDADMLEAFAGHATRRGLYPILLADGFCPACGRPAPIREFLEILRNAGGILVLDDTQALGVFGRGPTPIMPYGFGGGGMLPWSNLSGPDVITISSLAKGLGAPVAVVAGSESSIGRFEKDSETRVHCSPPSFADIHAAERALEINQQQGDLLRIRLARLVHYFRETMSQKHLWFSGGLFPIQTLISPRAIDVVALFERLVEMGIRSVPHRNRHDQRSSLSFVLTARHTYDEIDVAAEALACSLADARMQSSL